MVLRAEQEVKAFPYISNVVLGKVRIERFVHLSHTLDWMYLTPSPIISSVNAVHPENVYSVREVMLPLGILTVASEVQLAKAY